MIICGEEGKQLGTFNGENKLHDEQIHHLNKGGGFTNYGYQAFTGRICQLNTDILNNPEYNAATGRRPLKIINLFWFPLCLSCSF